MGGRLQTDHKQDFGGMWVFDESPPPGGRDATHLKIIYKPTHSEAEYRYDPGSGTYRRFDVGKPTIDELWQSVRCQMGA